MPDGQKRYGREWDLWLVPRSGDEVSPVARKAGVGKMPPEIIEMCRGSVVAFNTALNPRLLAPPRHIQIIGRLLDRITAGERINATISVPRRHGKSVTCTTGFPKYYLGRNPYGAIISASYNQTLADKFGREVSEGMQDKRYLDIFPDGELNARGLLSNEFRTVKGGEYIATGANGSLTGREYTLGICDDPIKNQEEAESETYRNRLKDWFHAVFVSSATEQASTLIIATRWGDDDLIGYVNREVSGMNWENYSFPALDENDRALWEERFSTEFMLKKRDTIPAKFWWSLYMQNPQIGDGGLIKRDKFWLYDPSSPPSFDCIYQSWDTAQKKNKRNDFSVCITWGVAGDKYYVLDIFMKRMEYPELREKAMELIQRFDPISVLIEDQSSGQSLIQDLRANLTVHVEAVNITKRGDDSDPSTGPNMDKDLFARVQRILPVIEAGSVVLPKGAPFTRKFLDECAGYDGSESMHDDQVSAMSLFLNHQITARFANPLSYRGYRGKTIGY